MTKIVLKLRRSKLLSTFGSWRSVADGSLRMYELAAQLITRKHRNRLLRSFAAWFEMSRLAIASEVMEEVILKREIWIIDRSFALWRHLTERTLALELMFDDLKAHVERIHLAVAFDKWMDFLVDLEHTDGHTVPVAVLHVPALTEVTIDRDKHNTLIDEPWTPGSSIHRDWSWPQQLESLQSGRAEQDWLGEESGVKTATTPKMVADLVADMRETRLTHQAKMHKLRSELVAREAAAQTLETGSLEEAPVLLEERAFANHHISRHGGENRGSWQEKQTSRSISHVPDSTPLRVRSQGSSPSTQWGHSTDLLLDDQAAAASRLFNSSNAARLRGSVYSHGSNSGLTLKFGSFSPHRSYSSADLSLDRIIQAQADLSAQLVSGTDSTG
jgi:hypothetical protein